MKRAIPVLALLCGCLGSNYRVSGGELDRIAMQPRSERGGVLRATQELAIGGEHLSGDDAEAREHVAALVAQELVIQTTSAVVQGARVRRSYEQPPELRRPAPRRGGSSRPARREQRERSERRENDEGAGAGAAVLVVAALVGAGALALAFSEGVRYDGWLQVDADHPVHLFHRRPTEPRLWATVPVSDITPEVAAWADGAVIDPDEGRAFRLGRAPLNRRGFALSLLAGAGHLDAPDAERAWGGGVKLGIGGFPLHHLGVQIITDIQGANGRTNTRFGGEVQGFLPSAGRLGFGLYFEGGLIRARLRDDIADITDVGGYYGAGGIVQVALATRMTLDLRGGFWTTNSRFYANVGLGFSIY